jgi:hypothetical protein
LTSSPRPVYAKASPGLWRWGAEALAKASSGDPYAVSPVVRNTVRRLWRNNYALWLWVPAFAGTTQSVDAFVLDKHTFAISPHVWREVWPARSALFQSEGARECRVPSAPAASCAHW